MLKYGFENHITVVLNMKTKIVPVITPFENNLPSAKYLKNHVTKLIEDGVDYIFLGGSSGLGPSLSFEERTVMLDAVKDYADRIIFQVGSLNMEQSLRLAEMAKEINAHAIAAYPPYYYPWIKDEWVINYYIELSKTYPLIIYNFPSATGYDVSPQIVHKIIDSGGEVIGIKETVNDIAHMLSYRYFFGKDFKVYAGFDSLILSAARSDLDGAIVSSGNYAPELLVKLLNEYQSEEADEIQRLIVELISLSTKYGLWSANYTMTRLLRGYEVGDPRPPVFPLSPEEAKKLEGELKALLSSEHNVKLSRYLTHYLLDITK